MKITEKDYETLRTEILRHRSEIVKLPYGHGLVILNYVINRLWDLDDLQVVWKDIQNKLIEEGKMSKRGIDTRVVTNFKCEAMGKTCKEKATWKLATGLYVCDYHKKNAIACGLKEYK